MNSYLHRWTQRRLQVVCKMYWKLETWTVPQRCKCRRVRWFSVHCGHPLSDRFETWEIDVHLCGLNISLDPEGACWSKNGNPTNAQLLLETSLAVKLAPNCAYIAVHWESVCVDQIIKNVWDSRVVHIANLRLGIVLVLMRVKPCWFQDFHSHYYTLRVTLAIPLTPRVFIASYSWINLHWPSWMYLFERHGAMLA